MVERPAVMNGSETEAQLKRQAVELEVEEIKMLRSSPGWTGLEHIYTYL